jgi:adenylate kinase family enzyme
MQTKRIIILGPCGAGKSTLARRIGERLSLPVVHLDTLFWRPGWVQTESNWFHEQVAEAVKGDAWVMDGNYTGSHLHLRLSRAHAVIWLDLPRHVYFPRVVWREIKYYGRARQDIGPGCPERIDLPFLKDWVWTYPTRSRALHAEIMASLPAGVRGIVLKSRAEVAAFSSDLLRLMTTPCDRPVPTTYGREPVDRVSDSEGAECPAGAPLVVAPVAASGRATTTVAPTS